MLQHFDPTTCRMLQVQDPPQFLHRPGQLVFKRHGELYTEAHRCGRGSEKSSMY